MEVPIMARLRLLFAMFLLCLGTWVATLAIGGPHAPRAANGPKSGVASASADERQFISFLTRQRFVSDDAPVKAKAPQLAARAKAAAVEKRRQQASAQWPWPLSLFAN
jgi:hypothetical protein